MIVGVGIKEVVTDILEDILDITSRHLPHIGLWIGNTGLVQHIVHGDRLPLQDGGSPAEARGEGDLGVEVGVQRVTDDLIKGAIEVTAPVEKLIGNRQLLIQPIGIRGTDLVNQVAHPGIWLQQAGEDRKQRVLKPLHLAIADIKIHHSDKLAVGSRIGHQGLATRVLDQGRGRHPVMGMSSEDGINPGDHRGHLQIHIHAIVGEDNHRIGTLVLPHLIHQLLHGIIIDSEGPVRHEATRVCDWGIGKGLPDYRNAGTTNLLDHIGLEGVTTVLIEPLKITILVVKQRLITNPYILCNEVPIEGLHILQHLMVKIAVLPVAGHHIHPQLIAGLHHIHATGLVGGAAPLPGITTIQ